MRLRRSKPKKQELNTPVPPMEVQLGEFYSYEGVMFQCVVLPRPAPDNKYTRIISRKYGLRRPINVKNDETVKVARNASVAR